MGGLDAMAEMGVRAPAAFRQRTARYVSNNGLRCLAGVAAVSPSAVTAYHQFQTLSPPLRRNAVVEIFVPLSSRGWLWLPCGEGGTLCPEPNSKVCRVALQMLEYRDVRVDRHLRAEKRAAVGGDVADLNPPGAPYADRLLVELVLGFADEVHHLTRHAQQRLEAPVALVRIRVLDANHGYAELVHPLVPIGEHKKNM